MAKREKEIEVTIKASELAETLEVCKATLTELRSELKEARRVIKDVQEQRQQVESMVSRTVEKEIEKEVHDQLEALGKLTEESMNKAVEKVTREFDKLENIVMTGTGSGRSATGFDLRNLTKETDND